jgi:GPH family glycoside/pentoside/hexuronide:cation symporter
VDSALANAGVAPACAQKTPTVVAVQAVQPKLTLLAYGGLALPLCLAEIPIILYLPAFYAQELRLSAGVVGAVFLVARLWDGLSDILVGWLSDRSMSRFGRRKPWVVVGAPFLMVSTWFLCNPHQGASFAYLSLWAALFYTSFTAVKIPHLSWGTELATDYVERSRVTIFRETFTMLGNLIFVSVPLIFLANDAPLRDVLFLISITVLVTVPPTALSLGLWVRDPAPTRRTETHLLTALAALASDRILLRFVLARLFWAIEEGVANSLLVFSFNVGLQLPSKLFQSVFILYVATLCAMPLTLRLGRRTEKHRLLAGAVAIQALIYATVLFIPTGHFTIVAALWIAIGIANTAMLSMPTSILADIIDHGEVMNGERRSGAYVALDNLIYKLGMAFGVGLSFGLLALVHYDPGAAHHGLADVRNIRLLGFGLPCLLSVPAIVLYLRHPITKKMQQQLREKIKARHLSIPLP